MPFIKSLRGVLIERSNKTWDDAKDQSTPSGAFCSILTESEKIESFWVPGELLYKLPEVLEVDAYDDADARSYRCKINNFSGKEKRIVVDLD